MIKIAPSILSADFARLGENIETLARIGADMVHFDVMDGHFVPNLTFGPMVLSAIRPLTNLPLDVHLMVEKPSEWIDPFLEAGADYISFHVEAERHMQRQLQRIRDAKKKAGLVLNPGTPAESAELMLEYCDFVLVMSVNPGFGGQKFLPLAVEKIAKLRKMAIQRGIFLDIEVDGGINESTAKLCIEAGATMLVAGNSVFSAKDPGAMVKILRGSGHILEQASTEVEKA